MRHLCFCVGLFSSVALAHVAHAAGDKAADSSSDKSDAASSDAPKSDDSGEANTPSDKPEEEKAGVNKATGDEANVADAEQGNSPVELPGKTYRFVGVRYRGIVVPKFEENLFASGGRTVYVNSFGPEFAFRKDGFEYNLGLWFALYNMDDTAFKGKSDPDQSWELINTKLTILYLTSDFLWSHEFTPEFALNYGFGAGLGFVFGNVYRSQSYPSAPGQNPNDYAKCVGPNDPTANAIAPGYCNNPVNDHYPGYKEPDWGSGGSKPIIFPWLALQTGLRYKASRQVVARLDIGYGLSGFFFGLGVDYGL